MAKINKAILRSFENFIATTDGTYVFNDENSITGIGILLELIKDMGLDPMKTEDLREGMMSLFNIKILNMPDLVNNRFIFTPNHVSDLDALILGLLNPNIRIVSKNDWTSNQKLRQFLDIHYDLYGLNRASLSSLRGLLVDAINYFSDNDNNKHYLVFCQGTISDFNSNSLDRISPIAKNISEKTGVPIVNVFIEQVSIDHPTRIVFDQPIYFSKKDDFRRIWLEREIFMQNALDPPARLPKLSYKHSNNNKIGDPFF